MTDRLTRRELSWLLTQEARGAAERLREGVQILSKPPPPPPPPSVRPSERPSERPMTLAEPGEGEGLESTLNMLDGAMQHLSQIYGPGSNVRGRRGRVDIAAILWEVAPDAKVELEPGSGTEVFGEEAELRRMLHVLLGASSQSGVGGAQHIALRRAGDEVRLIVALGPDTAPISDAERRWLARMAIRYGGRYELDGASECLIFPAEEAAQQKEVKELRKELDAAKAQGEAYARELAAVFADPSQSSRPPPMWGAGESRLGRLAPLARVADAIADDLRAILGPLGASKMRAQSERGANAAVDLAQEVGESLVKGAELLALARQMARIASDIDAVPVDLASLARDESSHAAVAFGARGVSLERSIDEHATIWLHGMPAALRAFVAELLDLALYATRPGGTVTLRVEGHALSVHASGTGRIVGQGARAAAAFLEEIAHAHEIRLEIAERSITARVKSDADLASDATSG
jgi:signal transduction histidine kinase